MHVALFFLFFFCALANPDVPRRCSCRVRLRASREHGSQVGFRRSPVFLLVPTWARQDTSSRRAERGISSRRWWTTTAASTRGFFCAEEPLSGAPAPTFAQGPGLAVIEGLLRRGRCGSGAGSPRAPAANSVKVRACCAVTVRVGRRVVALHPFGSTGLAFGSLFGPLQDPRKNKNEKHKRTFL